MKNGKKLSKGTKIGLGIAGAGALGGILYALFANKKTDSETDEVELLEEEYSETVDVETEDER